ASSRESSIEQAIVAHTLENGADLLVMGAYGHSWLREFLFGGVTRSILETTPVPTFVSH
ncbi:universal stress protein, partial [Salmonella enterica subsp. enterica]|nr:universal stress protein [Salmonella enterica subsp. enterica serovar Enteritidis]